MLDTLRDPAMESGRDNSGRDKLDDPADIDPAQGQSKHKAGALGRGILNGPVSTRGWNKEGRAIRLDPAEISAAESANVGVSSTSLPSSTAPAMLTSSLSQPSRRVAATLKLGTYDDTTSLDTFLAKVTNCREYYDWSEKDTVHHLRAS